MKKGKLLATALAVSSTSVWAGGLLTNTNQNAAYLRNFAQDGQITLTSIYANPAGNVFLSEGWHLSIHTQTAIQKRNITTQFPLFKANAATPGNDTHEFKGDAFAPVLPTISFSYNKPRWSVGVHFSLSGGGGKCEFAKGLGSFEALYAGTIASQLPGMVTNSFKQALPGVVAGRLVQAGIPAAAAAQLAATGTYDVNTKAQMTGYTLNSYMKGRTYYFGLQVGGAYKVLDNLSAYVGLRTVYGTCNYNGYVQDVNAFYAYSDVNYNYNVPANAALGFPGAAGSGMLPANTGSQDLASHTLTLNTDQTGWGFTPIIGIDYMINKHWNVAAKFEAPTKMDLKNKSEMNAFAQLQANTPNSALAQFKDGEHVREDIPGILGLGVQYSPFEDLRFNAGFHEYFDKSAKKYGDKQKMIDRNTWEVSVGAEWKFCKLLTASASWQRTKYGLSDAYMNDLSFNLSNHSMGLGFRIHPSKYFNIDVAYMHTFYGDRTVTVNTLAGAKVDTYSRKNDVIGVGFNFAL